MKRSLLKLAAAFCAVMITGIPFCSVVSAANMDSDYQLSQDERTSVEYLDNGLIIITTISESLIYPNSQSSILSSTYSKSGTKTQVVKNSSNETLFSFSVTGQFTVDPGISSICTLSSYNYSISDSAWSLYSATASKSGNSAYGSATFRKKLFDVVIDTQTLNIAVSCDTNGNIY